ncbi:MAG: hypothetical protein ABSG04_09280, partial [Verrucomicrobiota bacterium]
MKLLLHIRFAAHDSVERFLFPNWTAWCLLRIVDFVRREGFDRMQNFQEWPENRLAFLVLLFDLRFEKQVNTVGHHAGGIQFVTSLIAHEQQTSQNNV